MATNVTTYGVVYGESENNTVAMQAALDAGVALEISGYCNCTGNLHSDHAGTSIEGAGTLDCGVFTLYTMVSITGVTWKVDTTLIHATADLTDTLIQGITCAPITSYTGIWTFQGGCTTTGMIIDGIVTTTAPNGFIHGFSDGAEIVNCNISDTVTASPLYSDTAKATIQLYGSNNHVHHNTVDCPYHPNSIKLQMVPAGLSGGRLHKISGNNIHHNTCTGNTEECIVYDGVGGYGSCGHVGYVTDITGSDVTLNIVYNQGNYPFTAYDETYIVVNNGTRAGKYFATASKAGSVVTLQASPGTDLQVGDFVSVMALFIDNDINDNIVTKTATSGTPITLAWGAIGNRVKRNNVSVNNGSYAVPFGEILRTGIDDGSLVYLVGDFSVGNYCLNAFNDISDNTIDAETAVWCRTTVNFDGDELDYDNSALTTQEHMSGVNPILTGNTATQLTAPARVLFQDQKDVYLSGNVFPAIEDNGNVTYQEIPPSITLGSGGTITLGTGGSATL